MQIDDASRPETDDAITVGQDTRLNNRFIDLRVFISFIYFLLIIHNISHYN